MWQWPIEKCCGPASSIHKSHLGSHFPLALVLILGSVPESAWFLTLRIWLQDLAPLGLPLGAARTQIVLALRLFLLLAASETHSNQGILIFRISSLCGLLEKALCGEICQLGQKFLNPVLNYPFFLPQVSKEVSFSIPGQTLALMQLVIFFRYFLWGLQ